LGTSSFNGDYTDENIPDVGNKLFSTVLLFLGIILIIGVINRMRS
jgi:hypothetical protein